MDPPNVLNFAPTGQPHLTPPGPVHGLTDAVIWYVIWDVIWDVILRITLKLHREEKLHKRIEDKS